MCVSIAGEFRLLGGFDMWLKEGCTERMVLNGFWRWMDYGLVEG